MAPTSPQGQQDITKKLPSWSWKSIPNRGQLAVLAAARITEQISERSHATYLFYQMRSFGPAGQIPDSLIMTQVGILTASFAAAQCLTAVWWGRVADSPRVGRKPVLLIGLAGTAISSLGAGFSRNFTQILFFKIVGGALNANVGIMRTMIGEAIEPRHHSRAFLLLPMCLNIGEILGPLLGGFLSDPLTSTDDNTATSAHPLTNTTLPWLVRFPYLLPNLICALLIGLSALMVTFALDETHRALKERRDRGRQLAYWISMKLQTKQNVEHRYQELAEDIDVELVPTEVRAANSCDDRLSTDLAASSIMPVTTKPGESTQIQSRFSKLFTWRTAFTLLTHHILMLHLSAFSSIIFSFLSAPRNTAPRPHDSLDLHFTGGLGFLPSQVGVAMALLGLIGLSLQLLVYPTVVAQWGSLRSYRSFLPSSALAYIMLPFLTLLPDNPWIVRPCLALVLAFQGLTRTFALPSTIILVNNCSPDPGLRSTVHGLALSMGSFARILGPMGGGWMLGLGLEQNMVGRVWWGMAGIVGLNCILLAVLQSFASRARSNGTALLVL